MPSTSTFAGSGKRCMVRLKSKGSETSEDSSGTSLPMVD